MILKNQPVGSVPLCKESVTFPGYLGKMKKELETKYSSLVNQADTEPEFLVVNQSPALGKPRKGKG